MRLKRLGILATAMSLAVAGAAFSAPSGASASPEHVSHVRLNHMVYGHDAQGDYAKETVALGALKSDPGSTVTNSETITQIRAHFLGWYLNPSTASGNGGATIEHFPYLGSGKYGISLTYRYVSPATATITPAATNSPVSCILHPLAAGHCWNNPGTWDWGYIFGQKGVPGETMWDRLKECKTGAERTAGIAMSGPIAGRGLIYMGNAEAGSLLEINPYGLLVGILGTCSFAWFDN